MSGPQQWTVRFFKQLPARDYELHVVLASEGGFTEQLSSMGVKFHLLPSLVRQISPLRDIRSIIGLAQILRRETFDLVHTHSSKTGIIGRLAARVSRTPAVVHHVHGFAFHEFSSLWERRLYATLEWFGARFCDRVIFVNHEERIWAAEHAVVPEMKSCTIRNGVDLMVYNPEERAHIRPGARKYLALDTDSPVIAFIGRLELQKDPLQVVAMLTEMHTEFPEINPTFLVVGDGPLRSQLSEAIRKAGHEQRIHLLGWREDIPTILAAADVVYLPSRWEGLPLTLIEAACMGVPAVATDVKGNREVILDGTTGLLFPVGDTSAAARSVAEILSSPEQTSALGRAASERGRSHYDVRQTSDAVLQIYEELLAPRGPREEDQVGESGAKTNTQRFPATGEVMTPVNQPRVSAITPAYNAERYLEETLAAVQAQTFEDWEHVIVDDGSMDRTAEIAGGFADKDRRFRLIRHGSNLGVHAARNSALVAARGKFVAFLDADDLWLPTKLERQVQFMEQGGYAFSYHEYRCIDEKGNLLSPEPLWMPASVDYASYLRRIGTIGNLSVMLDLEQTGPLEMKNIGAEDFALFMQLLKRFKAYGLFEDLARHRVVRSSLSSHKLKVLGWVWNVLRNEEKLTIPASVRYITPYIYRGLVKNLIHKRLHHRG
jgi:glycosyltransferase involved in cell wall biosynthesis